ncbi:MAG: flavoprotein, partial [Euryarchaeota archaeon]|nr:flavoprotein [Euryarchaeota archaeon]
MRLIIGITGASGVQYGIRLAEVMQDKAEAYLIVTETARQIIE